MNFARPVPLRLQGEERRQAVGRCFWLVGYELGLVLLGTLATLGPNPAQWGGHAGPVVLAPWVECAGLILFNGLVMGISVAVTGDPPLRRTLVIAQGMLLATVLAPPVLGGAPALLVVAAAIAQGTRSPDDARLPSAVIFPVSGVGVMALGLLAGGRVQGPAMIWWAVTFLVGLLLFVARRSWFSPVELELMWSRVSAAGRSKVFVAGCLIAMDSALVLPTTPDNTALWILTPIVRVTAAVALVIDLAFALVPARRTHVLLVGILRGVVGVVQFLPFAFVWSLTLYA